MHSTFRSQAITWRSGFTIIELIIVVSLCGILLSLAIPALQVVREASRRAVCSNHLRQIALATHAFHDQFGALPRAAYHDWRNPNDWGDGYSWQTRLLPFLEQSAVAESILTDSRGEQPLRSYFRQTGHTIPGGETKLAIFRCPSSVLPDVSQNVGPYGLPPQFQGYGTSDYKASGGQDLAFGMFPQARVSHRKIRFCDVTDGLTHTLMFGESSYPGHTGAMFPIWIAYHDDFHSVVFNSLIPINDVPSFDGQFWTRTAHDDGALSMHPGVCLFAFGDGSVRPLSENIDQLTYSMLGSIADGLPFQAE